MSKRLPHIHDTQFPDLNNVDVFKYENKFDYSRWGSKTKINLYDVPWTSNYDNVVKFASDENREEYFRNLESKSVRLETEMVLQPQGNINLPLPFDVLSRYNYLRVEFPFQTSEAEPIEYESEGGRRVFYYFIKSVKQLSPNSTETFLQLDVWMTFINSCDFEYSMLERGHAPLAASKLDDYLSNPLKNNTYLLADDINTTSNYIVSDYEMEVLNKGKMYVCFSLCASISGNWGSIHSDSWQIPEQPQIQTQGVPNNLNVIAVKSEDYSGFMETIFSEYPQFYRTVRAIFLLPENLFERTGSTKFAGKDVYFVDATQKEILDIKLTEDMFGYNDKYKHLTKLYTFPYAYLELSDANGTTFQVRIENTNNNLKAMNTLNVAAPFLNMEMLFLGIGSDSEKTARFVNLDERSFIYGGDWKDYIIKYNIPCYAITSANYNEFDIDNYWDIEYLKGLAIANYQNDLDMNARTNDNSVRTNDANLANGQNLGTLAANEGNANANNISILGSLNVSRNTQNTSLSNGLVNYDATISSKLTEALQAIAAELTYNTTNSEIKKEISTAWASAVGGTVSSTINGAAGGAVAGGIGAGVGALAGAATGVVQGVSTIVANQASCECLWDVAVAQVNAAEGTAVDTVQNNSDREAYIRGNNTDKMNVDNNYTSASASTNASTTRSIGSYRDSTYKTNAANTQVAENTNANLLHSTRDVNAKRTYDATINGLEARKKTGKLDNVSQYGQYQNGDMQASKPMCIQWAINTKTDSEISQIGDFFLRYGYALNQNWDIENFNVMKNFTFWKFSEIWINTTNKMMNENHRNQIRQILYDGTTVWSNPDKIGKVSIYDN